MEEQTPMCEQHARTFYVTLTVAVPPDFQEAHGIEDEWEAGEYVINETGIESAVMDEGLSLVLEG